MPEIESTCPYCGVGCGLSVSFEEAKQSELPLVFGSPTHPANSGRLCSKGSALAETINTNQTRLVSPIINGEETSWDNASSTIAQRIQSSINTYGNESVAFYLSGQLLTEDYYVANKLMKGFIGTANVDTNSRLCMASAVAAYKRAFGADAVPCCYEDLDVAELIILIGSNAAWTHPVLYQRMVAAKEQNPELKIVLIDPRKTVTSNLVDLHLQLRSSSDGFLFQGLLNYLINNDHVDAQYVEKHTEGFDVTGKSVLGHDLQKTSKETGLSAGALKEFFQLFVSTSKVISFYSQGINQSATGTDKCNAIINCHLATGKIGYAGAGPFSITGQPNAMGGREVGGLATTLAAHMDFSSDETSRVQRFWDSPNIARGPGLKAVDLFDAVYQGKIKVIWIMATNPAVSLPDSNYVRAALERCETVIVSDITHNDSTRYADILLPALGWGEKDGSVTNSERCISRQRAFLDGPGLAKPDWWAISQVANKLGFTEQFKYQSAYEIFLEHAALSGFENSNSDRRCFDISGLSSLSEAQYDALQPIQWPVNESSPAGTKRLFADRRFYTKSGKAQFIGAAAKHAQALADVVQANRQTEDAVFNLNNGRLRDQWHTMTRTGSAASLATHDDLASVQMHPVDAAFYDITMGDFVVLSNKRGEAILRVEVCDAVARGNLFAPIHWNDQFSIKGVLNNLVEMRTDPISGQPESKDLAVKLEKFTARYWSKVVTRNRVPRQPRFSYWASLKCKEGYISLLASEEPIDFNELLIASQHSDEGAVDLTSSHYSNPITGFKSSVLSEADQSLALCYQAQRPQALPSSVWLANEFRSHLGVKIDIGLSLRGESGPADNLVCACFETPRKMIEAAHKQGYTSQTQIASKLACGSKCGSCKPEINLLIEEINCDKNRN